MSNIVIMEINDDENWHFKVFLCAASKINLRNIVSNIWRDQFVALLTRFSYGYSMDE